MVCLYWGKSPLGAVASVLCAMMGKSLQNTGLNDRLETLLKRTGISLHVRIKIKFFYVPNGKSFKTY